MSFNKGDIVRVRDQSAAPMELWGKKGLIKNQLPDPGLQIPPREWEPAYEVYFKDSDVTRIIEERFLEAIYGL